MAISQVNTPEAVPPALLHLWQSVMVENTWRFNQVTGDEAPLNVPCQVYIQPERDMLARTLYSAYGRIRSRLRYDLQPQWHTDKIRFGHGIPLVLESLQTTWKKIKAVGTRATSVIQSNAAIVYSKTATTTVDDTATITVATTITDPDEIQVFFTVADGAAGAADERWRIMPVSVTISGGNAIITGHRSLFVQPSIWKKPFVGVNQITRNEALTTVAANFVTQVDVYRVYPDPTNAVTLITDPILYNSSGFTQGLTQAGVAFIEDGLHGIYRVRLDGVCWKYYPEYVQFNYLAGQPLSYGDMDSELAEALVHLANCTTPQVPSALCDMPLTSFTEDKNVQFVRSSGSGYVVQDSCPFGIQIGAQKAWLVVQDRMMQPGGKITG
jgi:hypothetical protein